MNNFLRGIFCAFIILPLATYAQWLTQSVELQKGWNAVYLTVQPVPASCDAIFAGVPVERVHRWARVSGGAEFINDVNEELPRPSDWFVWRPASDPQSSLNSFYGLQAGKSYLIKTAAAISLNIKGRAVLVTPEWIPNSMSLTGLPVKDGVTFGEYFEHTDEIGVDFSDNGELYDVQADGSEMQVFRPTTAPIKSGKAYWIKTGQELDYTGPVDVSLSDRSSYIDFGSRASSRTLKIHNTTDAVQEIILQLVAGEHPPQQNGENIFPASEGLIPISYEQMNWKTLRREYVEMPNSLMTNIAANATFELKLKPRANELSSDNELAVWESLLKITSADGQTEQVLGMTCKPEDASLTDPTGLWVGSVVVDNVSRAPSQQDGTNIWDTVTPVPVSQPYSFRVLLHVSSDGTIRLLQQVFPAIVPGVDGGEPTSMLFPDAKDAKSFKQDHPDAEIVRISSANFPLMDPLELHGSFGGTNTINGSVVLRFDDPVNPFVHAFHPDHDNKKYNNGVLADEADQPQNGDESFTVTRNVEFTFETEDPLGANSDWQVSETGGVFKEEVTGLNKTIYVEGVFRLQKVSDCGVLSYLDQ